MPKTRLDRFFEILPGASAWATLIAPFIISIWFPVAVATFIIVYDLYWLYRSFRLTVNVIRAYDRMLTWRKTDWDHKLKVQDFALQTTTGKPTVATKIDSKDLVHVVLLIFYKESYELLSRSLESYAASSVPKDKLWLVLAAEERAGDHGPEIAALVKKHFGSSFDRIILCMHPAGLPGEIKSKSSNATYAAKELRQLLDKEKKSYDEILIHNFDADTRVYPNYFSSVACTYMESELGLPTSFQPLHTYTNNIWDTPALMRLIAQTASIVWLNNTLRPSRFKHFSSRSDVFATIVSINYWTVDAIPEDSRQYYDSYFQFAGKMQVVPIYIPLRMDAVLAEGYWRTLQNQYRQLRRWAWGIVDLPYIVHKSMHDTRISWRKKLGLIILLFENHYSWATSALFVTCVGWVPFLINSHFPNTVIGHNLPSVTRLLLGLALVGMATSVIVSLLLLPPRPQHRHKLTYVAFILQWFLSPIASIFLSSFAAIDAQTRLMFGRYMEYQVTEKAVAPASRTAPPEPKEPHGKVRLQHK